jgi:hypothetical protein
MPDRRTHRGPHHEDQRLFGDASLPDLRSAVDDLGWLLDRGYAIDSALKLTGDRYRLARRQRLAVARAVCAETAHADRLRKRLEPEQAAGKTLLIDGFNVLVSIEAALSGGLILECRDGCDRDLASVHGTYRRVAETQSALLHIGAVLAEFHVAECHWWLDSPVSNSGRLKVQIEQLAVEHGWNCRVDLAMNPDAILAESPHLVATADSAILDRCGRWLNLAREVIDRRVPDAWIVHL